MTDFATIAVLEPSDDWRVRAAALDKWEGIFLTEGANLLAEIAEFTRMLEVDNPARQYVSRHCASGEEPVEGWMAPADGVLVLRSDDR